MKANLVKKLKVQNELRQGCLLAPTSFNISANCVMKKRTEEMSNRGVQIKIDVSKKLGGYEKMKASQKTILKL